MQTFFDLKTLDDDFLSSNENLSALQLLDSDNKFSIIVGDQKSGKSVIAKKYSKLNDANLVSNISLDFQRNKKTYLDIKYLPVGEEQFFHFLQYFISQDYGLTIFTETDPFDDNKDKALKDIVSRLRSFHVSKIEKPGDELFFQLIQKYLKQKAISIPDHLIQEIMMFIDRTYLEAFKVPDVINYLLYKNNHNINLSLIKQHYEQI